MFSFLRSENMLVKPRKNYTKTTNSKHWLKKHPNLFGTMDLTRPEQAFLSDNMNAENVVQALNMAVEERIYTDELIHHSDRGLQYTSLIYQNKLKREAILPSMTDGYDCYQNALAERINGILKQEFLFHKCNKINELKILVEESIYIYNNRRPHLSLGMKTPSFVHKKTVRISHC